MRTIGCAVLFLCAITFANAGEQVLSKDELPQGTAATTGDEPLYLKLTPAPLIAVDSVVDEANANLTLKVVSRDKQGTMIAMSRSSGVPALKIDLYISPDGETWHYTSSCPVDLPVYENWPYPIAYFAIANPRAADPDRRVCE